MNARILPWVLPCSLLILWQIAGDQGWLSSRLMPTPGAVLRAGAELLVSGQLIEHLITSTTRAFAGFGIGTSLGLLLGVCSGASKNAEALLDTTMQMLRNVPHLALLPLVILWFGVDEQAKVFLVALGVLFPVYLNTYHGVRSIDSGLIEMSRVYGLNNWQRFRDVLLPGALPSILVGIRFSLGVMWLTLIVAETIASTSGIGYMAMNAREFMRTDIVVLSILLYALLGKLADWLARQLEALLLPWRERMDQ